MSTEDFQIEVTRINRRPESEPVKPKFELNVEDDLIPENYEPNFITAYELLQQPMFARKLTSGCPNIDQILDGGFPLFGITQISGESGCGKTQIGLQLALTCQYPEELGGLGAGVIYISTEDTFPANRLAELISNIPYDLDTSGFSDNVFVKHIYEGNLLPKCLQELPKFLSEKRIRLLIIDSIAGPFRFEAEDNVLENKYKTIEETGKLLQKMWKDFGLAVVCINQVTTNIKENGEMIPALGITWASFVTTNIMLSRRRDLPNEPRTFSVISAPHLPIQSCNYVIKTEGISSAKKLRAM